MKKEKLHICHAEKEGKFVIMNASHAFTRNWFFDPDCTIDFLMKLTEKAINEGFSALRTTFEMTWSLENLSGSERIFEYGSKLNERLFPDYPCSILCQFNRWKFDQGLIK